MQVGTPHSLSLPLPMSSPAQQITPMQVAPPCQTTTAMRISTSMTPIKMLTLTYSSEEASGLTSTAKDELLKGATLPCSPWREASLLNMVILVELTEGHRKMMDALRCLDTYSLQVHLQISASPITGMDPSQSPSELPYATSTRHPISSRVLQSCQQFGYHHSGTPPGLSTATTAEAPICHPDPEIEAAVVNMECNE